MVSGSTQSYMTRTLAILSDGRYVTAGLKYVGPSPYSFDVAVSRFLPDGTPDPSFGGGTVVTAAAPGRYDTPTVVLAQSDGKILVAGHTAPRGAARRPTCSCSATTPTARSTPRFGVGGKVVLDFGPGTRGEVHDLTFGSGGTIYLAGSLDQGDFNYADFAVVRLTAAGT